MKGKRQRYTEIKVFISSTFSDMNEERSYIVGTVFNKLRELYRDLPIHEIDLRWGLTDEEVNKGKVIENCLHYIYESRPFFIGILGDRYGSSFVSEANKLSSLTLNLFPHAAEHVAMGLSATEVEIQNGVLHNPNARALFFIKKNSSRHPCETEEQWQKLENLKTKIRNSHHQVVEYTSLTDFDVIFDFINKHVGKPELYDLSYDRADRAEKIFVRHYLKSFRYVKSLPYNESFNSTLHSLNNEIETAERDVAVVGMTGSGKSTALAHLIHSYPTERIYVPIYGDDVLPSSPQEFSNYLYSALNEMVYNKSPKFNALQKFINIIIDRIHYSNKEHVLREIAKYKWAFILDNMEAADYEYFASQKSVSINRLKNLEAAIVYAFGYWQIKYKIEIDFKFIIVRSMSIDSYSKEIIQSPNCRIINFGKYQWYNSRILLDNFLITHNKQLDRSQYSLLINSRVALLPKAFKYLLEYMTEYVQHDNLDIFILVVSFAESYLYVFELYLKEMLNTSASSAKLIIYLLVTCVDGISLDKLKEVCQHLDVKNDTLYKPIVR